MTCQRNVLPANWFSVKRPVTNATVTFLTLLTWTLSTTVDNILMLNCFVLSGLIVSEGLRKSSPNVTIFFQNFSLNSIAYIYLLVKFLFCLFFFMFICYQLW